MTRTAIEMKLVFFPEECLGQTVHLGQPPSVGGWVRAEQLASLDVFLIEYIKIARVIIRVSIFRHTWDIHLNCLA